MTTDSLRAALYARISKADMHVDKIANQLEDLRKLAADSGYTVVATFEDDDISAFKGSRERPGFLGLLSGINAGEFDVAMATEPQRFTRGSAGELEALQLACVKAGAIVHTRAAGVQDPATPTVSALQAIMDVIGGLEVATKIERQRARNRADRAAGLPSKGVRPFGFEVDRITVREAEAVHIRQATEDILRHGATTWSIAQRWNALGIQTDAMNRERKSTSDGKRRKPSGVWTTTAVKQILRRPSNAGILVHDGAEMPNSQIEPIVSVEDYRALVSVLKGSPSPAGPKPQYLLGGLLECVCGARMHATTSNTARKGSSKTYRAKIYRCRLYGFDKTSPHVTISQPLADQVVTYHVVTDLGFRVASGETADTPRLTEIQVQLGKIQEITSTATELILEGIGDVPQLKGKLQAYAAEKTALEQERDTLIASNAYSEAVAAFQAAVSALPDSATDDDIAAVFEEGQKAFEALPLQTRRAIIRGGYRIGVLSGGRGADRIWVSTPDGRWDLNVPAHVIKER